LPYQLYRRATDSAELAHLRTHLRSLLSAYQPYFKTIKGKKIPVFPNVPEETRSALLSTLIDEMVAYFTEFKSENVRALSEISVELASDKYFGPELADRIVANLYSSSNTIGQPRMMITEAFRAAKKIQKMSQKDAQGNLKHSQEWFTARVHEIFMTEYHAVIPEQHQATVMRILFRSLRSLPLDDQTQILGHIVTAISKISEPSVRVSLKKEMVTAIENLQNVRKSSYLKAVKDFNLEETIPIQVEAEASTSTVARMLKYLGFRNKPAAVLPHA
jgi:hypothetical protein